MTPQVTLQFGIDKRGDRRPESRPQFRLVGDDRIIGSTTWLDDAGRRNERYQVLTIRDGKIVDMQGCRTRRGTERFGRRKAR